MSTEPHDTHTPCCSIPEEHVWADPIRCLRCKDTWPCAQMIEEGPPEPTLDVERLARVLQNSTTEAFGPITDAFWLRQAEALAAEYQRLDPAYQATLPTADDVRGILAPEPRP